MKGKKWPVLITLSLIAGLVYLTPFLRFSFYDQMKEALELGDLGIGTIGAVYGAFNVAGYVPGGYLAEKVQTKRLLLISCLGMLVCTIWYSFYPDYVSLLIIHALYGIFSVGTFWSAYLKAVRNLASEEEQGKIFGISEGMRGLGQAGVAFLCLFALGTFASVKVGFRAVLWINSAAFGLLFLAVMILVPNEEKQEKVVKKKGENLLLRFLKNPSVWICIFVIMCGYVLWNTVNGYLGTYCTRILKLSPEVSSILSIMRSYIIVFGAGITGGIFMDKFSSKGQGMLAAFILALAASAGIFFTETQIVLCVGITLILAYVVNAVKSTYWSILGEAGIPQESTGMATGVISVIALTPDIFVTPVISRFISWGEKSGQEAAGFHLMMLWMVIWSVLGICSAVILKRKAKK